MINIIDNELVFAFPDVQAAAELCVHFRRVDAAGESVPIVEEPIDGGNLLTTQERLVMHLRPRLVSQEF